MLQCKIFNERIRAISSINFVVELNLKKEEEKESDWCFFKYVYLRVLEALAEQLCV